MVIILGNKEYYSGKDIYIYTHVHVQSLTVPWAEVVNNGEKSIVYYEDYVQVRFSLIIPVPLMDVQIDLE